MQNNSLNVNVIYTDTPVVQASGELDQDSCCFFESVLNSVLGTPCNALQLALGKLSFIDSSGLRILIKTAVNCKETGCGVKIISITPHLDHLLSLSGFKHLFDISEIEPEKPHVAFAADTSNPLAFAVLSEKGSCRMVRDRVDEFAATMGFCATELDDIKLAVGEAISNAVRHGAQQHEIIQIQCENDCQRLIVKLKYPGNEFDPYSIPVPNYSTASEGGMGIYFMNLVMDKVEYSFTPGFTELTIEKKLCIR